MRRHITPSQLKKLHTLLSNAGMMEMKADMVQQYSNGRTTSSRQLFQDEAQELINTLAKDDPCTKMKKKCVAICFTLGWFEDGNAIDWQINWAALDSFLLKRGVVKKRFRQLNCKEVYKVLTQLEGVEKHCKDTAERKRLADEINKILAETGLSRPVKADRGTSSKIQAV